jgi:hypothetical protein
MSDVVQLILYVVGWVLVSAVVYWFFDIVNLKRPGILPLLVAFVVVLALANRWSPNLIERILRELFPVFASFMYGK